MASAFSHVVAALGIGACFYRPRVPRRVWVTGAICSVIPDLDVIGKLPTQLFAVEQLDDVDSWCNIGEVQQPFLFCSLPCLLKFLTASVNEIVDIFIEDKLILSDRSKHTDRFANLRIQSLVRPRLCEASN